jgi:hypothetical protein
MQNAKWPCNAGADHWNVCIGHSNGLLILPPGNCKFPHIISVVLITLSFFFASHDVGFCF